jgi:ABC-type uncharacterized transport system involved in gliding motility auxiliary subunit
MKRLIDLLAPLGFLVVIGSMAWVRAGRELPGGKGQYYVWAGALLVLVHLVLRFEDVLRIVGRRQMKYGANSFVLVAVVLGILGAVNYLVFRHSKRWDLTKGQRYSLSDQTRKILAGLKEDVKIVYFQRAANAGEGPDRLKEYEHASPRVKTEFIDPVAKPGRARDYEITAVPTLVVERGAKREKISNDSEQDISNALIKVTRDSKKTVCFASGEGEADLDDVADGGLSGAKAALAKNQYETKKVVLLQESKLPQDCTVLVVAGPQKDLLPQVVDQIRAYVKGGGKAMLMEEPELKTSFPNFSALLKEWNIETARDVVLDYSLQNQLSGTGALTPLAAQYPYHEITKDFRLATAFHTARSMKAGSASPAGVHAQNLVETSSQSWAESDLSLKEPVEQNEGKDQKGPISLAAVATIELESPSPAPSPSPSPAAEDAAKPKKPEARVVAFGDVDFASNAFLGFPGNADLFLNSVAWLAQDADLISIRPKEADDQRLFLTGQQVQNVFLLSLVLLPGLFVVLGIFSWWRRR